MAGPRILDGRYEVGALIGRGGMADVHRGRDLRLGREVAIKLLRPDLARDPMFQARFRREAQAVAGLNHPSIVAVYDTGEEPLPEVSGEGLAAPFIVMEYVEGRTLRELLRAGEITVESACRHTLDVLDALAYSHRKGIVHRDIKPANVMVTPDGRVKVMDFGIARALADAGATMTQTQTVVGTAQYFSPEQARGESADARSDLYSAGCLLFELLTGRPPFIGDSPLSVAYQHVSEQAPLPGELNPDVPAALDAVVERALRKDREDRYQGAADFAAALAAARAAHGPEAATQALAMTPPPASGTEDDDATAAFAVQDGPPTRAHGPQQHRDAGEHGEHGDLLSATMPVAALSSDGLSSDGLPPNALSVDDLSADDFSGNALSADLLSDGFYGDQYAVEHAEPALPSRRGGQDRDGQDRDGQDRDGQDRDGQDHGDGARKRAWITVLALAVVVVLGTGGWLLWNWSQEERARNATVAVPEVANMTLTQAQNALIAVDLRPLTEQVFDDTVPKDLAVGTKPLAGEQLRVDSEVRLLISMGPEQVRLPKDLAGQSEASVERVLTDLGLLVGEVSHDNSATVPRDRLVGTNPGLGEEVKAGSTVDLTFSTGKVTVPRLIDMTEESARAALADDAVQLNLEVRREENSLVEPGTIIRQEQAPGSDVEPGSTVVATVAAAPAAQEPDPSGPEGSGSSDNSGSGNSGNGNSGNGNGNGNSGNGSGNSGNGQGNGNGRRD
ncbi:protein kinase domain-containing protein [Zafaria cholistanensis]|uniref:protein kinase domain-containing protein n=1 Tax=Zafaria cholistanensis TaxID=1682741 RepID=UPI0012305F59|nr:PASTA domain-containing protein [Zafaria cholistanensis]